MSRPHFKGRSWTDADDRVLDTMKAHGRSVAEIARALGRTHSSILNRTKAIGTLTKAHYSKHWSAEEVMKASQMRRDGIMVKVIADHLGRTAKSVQGKLNAVGVTKSRSCGDRPPAVGIHPDLHKVLCRAANDLGTTQVRLLDNIIRSGLAEHASRLGISMDMDGER